MPRITITLDWNADEHGVVDHVLKSFRNMAVACGRSDEPGAADIIVSATDAAGSERVASAKADRLRAARIAAGYPSARQAAMRNGWTPSTYAAHENGQNEFDDDHAVVYGDVFGVSPAALLGIQSIQNNGTYALQEAIERVGGVTKLGAMLGISHQAVVKWLRVPAERVHEIERLTGIVRHRLRPDLYPVEREILSQDEGGEA